jgi:DDE family transposase
LCADPKRLTETDPELPGVLECLVDPLTRGDPESPLRWTCKNTACLAEELTRQGHPISPRAVAQLLKDANYSLQGNRKTQEGSSHPDRNAQFEYINAMVQRFQRRSQPVISVDAKKKEAVDQFKNGGREWQPKGAPEEVLVHDFVDKELGKVNPYGVFDLTRNEGWVSVGIDHDTAPVRGASHWPVVAEDGCQALSPCSRTVDHGRRGRQQRQSMPLVESGSPGVGRTLGDTDPCVSFSTRDQ